jgi:hypothetical protein
MLRRVLASGGDTIQSSGDVTVSDISRG